MIEMKDLWDPEQVVRMSLYMRQAVTENFQRIHELGEGLHPQQVIQNVTAELGIPEEMVMFVMFAGDLIETDRAIRDYTPYEREEWRERRQAELDYLEEQVKSGDALAELAASQHNPEEIEFLENLWESSPDDPS